MARSLRGCCWYGCCSPACTCGSVTLLAVLFVAIFLCNIFIGAEIERAAVLKQTDTHELYTDDRVCVLTHSDSTQAFANVTVARENEGVKRVLNCGTCGACSNTHDIAVYTDTKDTLTDTATSCALNSFLGRKDVEKCFITEIGLSGPCTECWVDNVMCDQQHCKWTCLKMLLLDGGKRKNTAGGDDGELNHCLECDERMCGPAFFRCARANRRTSGVISDIGRLSAQNCNKTGRVD